MNRPNLGAATAYALERLARDLSPKLTYHSLIHTRDEVAPAAERLARAEGVAEEPRLLVVTAAHYHDLGYVEGTADHERVSVAIAADVLPSFGYSQDQVRRITSLIMVTQLPQSPRDLLGRILADADLDGLGQANFLQRTQDLRQERENFGLILSDEEWYRQEVGFLEAHEYWTEAARRQRDQQKAANLALMRKLLSQYEAGA